MIKKFKDRYLMDRFSTTIGTDVYKKSNSFSNSPDAAIV